MGSKVLEGLTVDIRREISDSDRKVIRDGSEGLQELKKTIYNVLQTT